MSKEKRGLYGKIINIILDIMIVLFGFVLLISIYNNIQVKLLGNKYSSFFGYSTFEVQTGSMSHTINPGDWIIVKKSNDIELNDIITYEKGNDFITHRVIESYKGTYVTKGDANNSKDDAINQGQIIGKVVKIIPCFGIIKRTFLNPYVLIALIITLYLFSYVLKNVKENTKQPTQKNKLNSLINKAIDNKRRKSSKSNNKKASSKIDEEPLNEVEAIEEKIEKQEEIIEKELHEEEITTSKLDEEIIESEEEILEEETEEIVEEEEKVDPENYDKTMYFRMISVDKEELNNNNIEVPQVEEEEEEIIEDEKSTDDFHEVKEKLKLIQNRRKKFKNIIEKTIYIKKEEIEELITLLTDSERARVNENTIKDTLVETYIDGKYYNFCGNVNAEYNNKNMLSKIDNELKIAGESLVKSYKGNDTKYREKVDKYVGIMILINALEQVNRTVKETPSKRDAIAIKLNKFYKSNPLTSLKLKNTINKIIKIQRVHSSMIKYCLNELESNTFELEYIKVNKKQLIGVSLKHNISFSKVYSDYIVDKTYTEGVIAEDKVIVLLNLLLLDILKDMLNADFSKKYLVHVPGSIYSKSNKLHKTFGLIEDEFAKDNIIILINYTDLISNKKIIKDLKKQGYHFACFFSNETNVKASDQKIISVADFLFIDKKSVKDTNILESIPEELKGCIFNNNVIDKMISDGGK